MKLSQKQNKLINDIKAQNIPEINVLGSVQSGKTFSIALGIIMYASELHKYDNKREYFGAIIGWDLQTLKGNIIEPLRNHLEEFGYKENKDYELVYGQNDKYFKMWNVKFYFFGFNTKIAFNRILGRPLIFIWIDESARIYGNLSLQESFDELPGRQVSFSGHPFKKTIHSFNVEGNERHPYKMKYIDKGDKVRYTFYPFDNPQLDTEQKLKEAINTFPRGALREQKIYNKWVVAEGRVFNKINVLDNLEGLQIKEIGLGVDYGSVNPTTFVPIALAFDTNEHRWKIIRLECYYHDPAEEGEKPTTAFYVEQEKLFIEYLQSTYKGILITANIVDSEATHFCNALYNANMQYEEAKKGPRKCRQGSATTPIVIL
jgi:PBSX family phage terminase large subunit